jgi:hypothetical protein
MDTNLKVGHCLLLPSHLPFTEWCGLGLVDRISMTTRLVTVMVAAFVMSLSSFKQVPGFYLRKGHHGFFPYSFEFIIQSRSYILFCITNLVESSSLNNERIGHSSNVKSSLRH